MSSAFADTLAKASSQEPAPGGSTRTDSSVRHKARREMRTADERFVSNIKPGHEMAFTWLRSGSGQCGLVSCTVNGHPSALIIAARETEDELEIMPLFVALTAGMEIRGPDGQVIWSEGGAA
ncbi:MAG: hypothetical protein GC204_03745 [Chloroflexi bacterium]|nr:hypothetical protein [Chloroflexota bacterium]